MNHAAPLIKVLVFFASLGAFSNALLLADEPTSRPAVLSIGNFENGTDGFDGAVQQDANGGKTGKSCAILKNDKPSGWVEGGKNLPTDLIYDFKEVHFWVKSTTAQKIGVRLTDATGQEFQHRPGFKDDGQWQQITITDPSAGMESWGGAGDKKWHAPCKRFQLILEGGNNDVAVDGIEAVLADNPIPALAEKAAALAKAEKVSIGDFETDADGFNGALVTDPTAAKVGKASGKIDNPTDKWVECGKDLNLPRDIAELHFWVKSSNATMIGVRMTDSTGQSFQNRPSFPADGQWHLIKMSQFAPAMESWGGANDKQWHGPAKRIDLILETKQSTVWVDGIEVLLVP